MWSTYRVDWSLKCHDMFDSHTLANEQSWSPGLDRMDRGSLTRNNEVRDEVNIKLIVYSTSAGLNRRYAHCRQEDNKG